ncbi:MAG: hypothetical protein IAF38_01130 [Bacteroidia bacterium]|nr:hypothetical protein [Bacteroidia bacterium]
MNNIPEKPIVSERFEPGNILYYFSNGQYCFFKLLWADLKKLEFHVLKIAEVNELPYDGSIPEIKREPEFSTLNISDMDDAVLAAQNIITKAESIAYFNFIKNSARPENAIELLDDGDVLYIPDSNQYRFLKVVLIDIKKKIIFVLRYPGTWALSDSEKVQDPEEGPCVFEEMNAKELSKATLFDNWKIKEHESVAFAGYLKIENNGRHLYAFLQGSKHMKKIYRPTFPSSEKKEKKPESVLLSKWWNYSFQFLVLALLIWALLNPLVRKISFSISLFFNAMSVVTFIKISAKDRTGIHKLNFVLTILAIIVSVTSLIFSAISFYGNIYFVAITVVSFFIKEKKNPETEESKDKQLAGK